MKRYRKIFTTLIIVIGIMVLCQIFYLQYTKNENINNNLNQKSEIYNEKLRELRKEKEKLNFELEDLYDELYTGDLGSTIILLTDTHADCLDDAVTYLEKYKFRGVIALSYQYLPEDNHKNYLTRDQINELVDEGYELVIKATTEDLGKTYERFKKLGYDIKGFYFEDIVVNNLMVEEIRKLDSDMVVIGNYLDSVGVTDTLLINYYGSRQQNVKTYYEDSVEKSKVIALTVGYDKSSNRYDKNNFKSMLDTIQDYVYDDKTEVCNITSAIERNNIYIDKLSQIETEKYNRVTEIKNRLAEIGNEMMEMEFE